MQVTQHSSEVVPLIEGHDLVVVLQGNEILHGVDALVMPGETVALMGGNGSGKTTLVRTLLGLNPLQSGSRRVFGSPLARFHQWDGVGYVPQRGALNVAAATVGEIVAAGRLSHRRPFMPLSKADRHAIDQALEKVNLGELRKASFTHLSGGQQQRTLIARALCTQPKLLVLDEPLAGLDMHTQSGLARVLGELKADGMGILVVLHELGPMAELIDRSIFLQEGRVIHDGPLLPGTGLDDCHPHPSHGLSITPEPAPFGRTPQEHI